MENMREYWAREAEMMRDKSAVLGDRTDNAGGNGKSFSANITETVNTLHKNGVTFGLNRVRNIVGSGKYDPALWSIINDASLRLNQGKTPSEGIQSILDNSFRGWTFDCAEYVQVVYLGACLLTDGANKFNLYIKNILKQKGVARLELHPHGSIGVESKELYLRDKVNILFTLDTDQKKAKSEDDVLNAAPIGSRVTVANFYLNDLIASGNKDYKAYAEAIFWRGWAFENMIKVSPNRYAAFGIGTNVTLREVKEELLKAHYLGASPAPSQKAKDAVMAFIGISQVLTFQRS